MCGKAIFAGVVYSPVLTDAALRLRLQRVTCGCGRWIWIQRLRPLRGPIGYCIARGHASQALRDDDCSGLMSVTECGFRPRPAPRGHRWLAVAYTETHAYWTHHSWGERWRISFSESCNAVFKMSYSFVFLQLWYALSYEILINLLLSAEFSIWMYIWGLWAFFIKKHFISYFLSL